MKTLTLNLPPPHIFVHSVYPITFHTNFRFRPRVLGCGLGASSPTGVTFWWPGWWFPRPWDSVPWTPLPYGYSGLSDLIHKSRSKKIRRVLPGNNDQSWNYFILRVLITAQIALLILESAFQIRTVVGNATLSTVTEAGILFLTENMQFWMSVFVVICEREGTLRILRIRE
jgi:hypothetical protein